MPEVFIFPNGAKVRIVGDKRFPDEPLAVVYDNRNYPLYGVRLSGSEYDTKAKTTVVGNSKLQAA